MIAPKSIRNITFIGKTQSVNPGEKIDLKRRLKEECIRLLELRLMTSTEAMQRAQESANEEGKSSAGDKYETSRAMGQLDRDMNAKQADEVRRELSLLHAIDVQTICDHVTAGAFISCANADYFIAAGLGVIHLGGEKFIALSPKAPLAMAMKDKRSGENFLFQNKVFEIKNVY